MLSLLDHTDTTAENLEYIGICGCYCGSDNVHVGIFWNSEGEKRVFHFQNGNFIPVEDLNEAHFSNYQFVKIPTFKMELLPLLAATAELVSQNMINNFTFNRPGALYDGGKFEYLTGNFTGNTIPEKFVNCAVFTFAFLQSFEHLLIKWDTWPNLDPADRAFLDSWLDDQGVSTADKDIYYNKTKKVRGRHILVSPLTNDQPSSFLENETLSLDLIKFFTSSKNQSLK